MAQRALIGIALLLIASPVCRSPAEAALSIPEGIRSRIEAVRAVPQMTIEGEVIHASTVLPRFYESRGFRAAWSAGGGPGRDVEELLGAIREAGREGLLPEHYHLRRIEKVLGRLSEAGIAAESRDAAIIDLDLLCTDAFLIYASHLLAGRINPNTLDPEWHANRREADLAAVLERALAADGIAGALEQLLPRHPGYEHLRNALALYRAIAEAGGWPDAGEGPKIEPGDVDSRVGIVRRRLIATGDLSEAPIEQPDLYDPALADAVRRFQQRHGLDDDRIIGPATRAALNVDAEARVRQIVLNLERWRWLPQDLGSRYILVNIPDFTARVHETDSVALEMRAIVGRPYRRTPVFTAAMTYLVLSPFWEVPPNLAIQDKLPEIRKDVAYLARQRMKVFRDWGAEAKEIDPTGIDWSRLGEGNFPYRLRQEPGPNNALGRVKFMFPNPHNVYLHDTPNRELFAKSVRGFSSGCIRIEKPIELALYLLSDQPEWTEARIQAAIERMRPETVTLKRPIPVHLLYWTAWADDEGRVQFRSDIYERDRRLDEALQE